MTTRKNLYPGVNPHLNSALQSYDLWAMFQMSYLVRIEDVLDQVLPEHYHVWMQRSLQVDPESDEAHLPMGTVVYHSETIPSEGFGQPVVRLEILRQENKRGGENYTRYLQNRIRLLDTGIVLVEVDFLHETPPIDLRQPSYIEREHNATPYSISVIDPRPSLRQGSVHIFGFNVSGTIPIVDIPLLNEDSVKLDFAAAYQLVFENRRVFQHHTDYTEQPLRFETYSTEDQQYILQRMAEISRGEA
jgi:hypothetical protein